MSTCFYFKIRLFVTSFAPSAFTDFIATMSDPTSDTPSIIHRILPSFLSTACMSCIAENVRSPRYAVSPCVLAVLSDPGGPHATQVITDGTYHGLLLSTQNRLPLRNFTRLNHFTLALFARFALRLTLGIVGFRHYLLPLVAQLAHSIMYVGRCFNRNTHLYSRPIYLYSGTSA